MLLARQHSQAEIFKVKGLNKNIHLTEEDFTKLLNKDTTIIKSQDKIFRRFEESTIYIKNQLYTSSLWLQQQTANKRELIYDSNNNLIGTKAYKLINKKITLEKE